MLFCRVFISKISTSKTHSAELNSRTAEILNHYVEKTASFGVYTKNDSPQFWTAPGIFYEADVSFLDIKI